MTAIMHKHAHCQCGEVAVEVAAAPDSVVACHCRDCQRRSGSPFGVIAYYPAEAVSISGYTRAWTRPTDSGTSFTTGFCPRCGTTVWARADKHPASIGVPVGIFADPAFPPPIRSVYERTKHAWVAIPGDIPHFPRGRA